MESAAEEATGSGDTDAPVQELLLTPEETAPVEMTAMDEEMMKQAVQGMEMDMPDGSDIVVDKPECTDAEGLFSTITDDIAEDGIASLVGSGDGAAVALTLQLFRTEVSFDEYKRNWENCDGARITSDHLGMNGMSRTIPAPEIEGADEAIARQMEMTIKLDTSQFEGLGIDTSDMGPTESAQSVYLTEVRGVKVVMAAMTPSAEAGGKLDPGSEQEIKDLLTMQVAKINDPA